MVVLTRQMTPNLGASSSTRYTHRLCVLLHTHRTVPAPAANTPWRGMLVLGCPRAALLSLPSPQSSPVPPWMGLPSTPGSPNFSICSCSVLGVDPQPTAFCQISYSTVPLAAVPTTPLAPGWHPSLPHRLAGQQGLGRAGRQQRSEHPPHSPRPQVSLGPPLGPRL